MKPVFDETIELCKHGHPLWVKVSVTESFTYYDQPADCTMILEKSSMGKRAIRHVLVSCDSGCEVSKESESTMLRRLKNTERA